MSLFQPSRGNASSTAASYQSPPWSASTAAPPQQPSRTSAIGYEGLCSGVLVSGASSSLITDRHIDFAFFPLNNPGIVAIPVAFFLGWLSTMTDRRPADSARFARMQVRALTGVGAERGGHA